MTIVEATKDHIFAIQALADRIWPPTFQEILTEEQIVYMMNMMYSTSSLEKQIDESCHYLLVEEDAEYIGFVSYEVGYKEYSTTKIHKIYVLPSIQGKGIGRFMIDAVEKIARKNNSRNLILNVNRFNKALEFYKRIGFEILAEEDIDIGKGFLMQDYIMNKIIR